MWFVHKTWRCKYRHVWLLLLLLHWFPVPSRQQRKRSHMYTLQLTCTHVHTLAKGCRKLKKPIFNLQWGGKSPCSKQALLHLLHESWGTWVWQLLVAWCMRACVCARAWERMSEEIKWQRVKQTDWETSLREKCGQRERLSRSEKWQIKDLAYLIQHFPVQLQ